MILDAGLTNVAMKCDGCTKVHHGVSIGEEVLMCSCGCVLTFQAKESYYDYFWVSAKMIRSKTEHAIGSDNRNLN